MQTLAEKSTDEINETYGTPAAGGRKPEQPAIAFARAQKGTDGKAVRGFRRRWAIGAGCVMAALVMFRLFHSTPLTRTAHSPAADFSTGAAKPAAPQLSAQSASFAGLTDATAAKMSDQLIAPSAITNSPAPMIARTISLNVQVMDIAGSRAALDSILAKYQGYVAELAINTPENAPRSFSVSLRIPAPALNAALAELRRLGRVQNETQAGEEVTQQHADLVARLKNARETEKRLLAILQQRTGKVEEVLQVEEQISNTRGEIERMEAEQKALEHRVDFATVQVQLAEEFKAQLNAPSSSVGTRVRNAFVNGLGNAGDSMLGFLLLLEEFGPVLLVWFAVLGTPAWLVWRRFRRVERQA